MKDLKIVLKESVSNSDVSLFAWQQDWELYEVSSRTETTPLTKIWITSDQKTGIHYLEDFYINNKYLLLKGQNQELIEKKIRASLDTYSLEEICQKSKKQDTLPKNEYINTVLSLGVAINQDYNQELFNNFKDLMSNSDADVREAAIFATTYLGWKEFYEPLQRLKNEDPSPSVQEFAADTLASLEKNYWKEQRLSQLKEDKEQLQNLQAQLQKAEESIENARRTNIWGRPQSGKIEAERDKLVQEIAEIQEKITQNESLLEAEE